MASIVSRSSRWSFTLAAASTALNGPPSPSTSTLSLHPIFPRSVGFLPTFFPPEPGLAQPAVRTLPLPIHGPQFVTLGHQYGPDALHDAAGAPALEPVVDGALGRPEVLQEGEDPLPEVIGDLPDGGQGLGLLRLGAFGLG